MPVYKLHVHPPRVTQHHHEGVRHALVAIMLVLEHSEVNLSLLTRLGLESNGCLRFLQRPEGLQEIL
ncbi:MAG TPA: hypothetical protein GXX30_00700 [Firmicutes bacterium]|nr:hypothetical protein [Candidatus Fermentithermobacillaceae bacterium]